jgi:hypothetical protein
MGRSEYHNHGCFIYDTLDEYLTFTTAFMEEGLMSDEQVLCIADWTYHDQLLATVAETVDVERALRQNQLHLYPPEVFYLAGGAFNPERVLGQLQKALTTCATQGFSGLRVCGDTTWALQQGTLTTLIDYEAQINNALPTSCVAVCQYNRPRFPGAALFDVTMLHHHIKIDGQLIVNPFYQTASNLLLSLKHHHLF